MNPIRCRQHLQETVERRIPKLIKQCRALGLFRLAASLTERREQHLKRRLLTPDEIEKALADFELVFLVAEAAVSDCSESDAGTSKQLKKMGQRIVSMKRVVREHIGRKGEV